MQDLDFATHKTYLSDLERAAAPSRMRPVGKKPLPAGTTPVLFASGLVAMLSFATYALIG